MIHLGIHTDNWRTLSGSFEAACEATVKHGMKHIEFAVIDGQYFINAMGYDPSVSLQSNPVALRRYLDKMELEVSQIDSAFPMMGPKGSTFGVQYVQQGVRFAKEIGCPMVDTTDGAFEIEGLSRDEVFRITCDNYREALIWAEDYQVILNVEPHGPYTTDADFMHRLFNHFDSEYLRFNFDTGNTFIAGLDPLEYLTEFRKYLSHLHIKDVSEQLAAACRGEETGIATSTVPVGGGVNAENIRRCMEYLKSTDWDGVVSIECYGSDENLRDSVAFLKPLVSRP